MGTFSAPGFHYIKYTLWAEYRKFRGSEHSLWFERCRQVPSRSTYQPMASDSPELFSPCPFSGWPRASSGSFYMNLVTPVAVTAPSLYHVPCDLGYLGDCALSQCTHSHTLTLPRLGEISRPDHVTLPYVQAGSWGWGSWWGLFSPPAPSTEFVLPQDIQRLLSGHDQFFYSLVHNTSLS